MYYYWDFTYILVLIGMVLCLAASALVKSTMGKYKKVHNMAGLSGAEAAKRILQNEGIYDVAVVCLDSYNNDHYDPRNKQVRLSYDNYYGTSVTSVAVAAHECGHAIQHEEQYSALAIRSALVPVVGIAEKLGVPLILVGILLSYNELLIRAGIYAFGIAVLFQLLTLPVEFNASYRALGKIGQYGLLTETESGGARKVLIAAALTYVAAAASSALQLLRLILLFGGKNSGRRGRR